MLVVRKYPSEWESLFGIKNEEDRLYMNILNSFEMIAIRNVEDLVEELCEAKGISIVKNSASARYYDIEININGEKKRIDFRSNPKTMNSSSVNRIAYKIKEDDVPTMIVFLLKDGMESRKAVARFESEIKKIEEVKVECILFEEFLECLFGQEEKNAFQEEMADFNEEIHKVIGYQITELCSPYNLEKLKQQLDVEISTFDYEGIKLQRDAMLGNGLKDNKFRIIKDVFINDGRYKLLIGNSDFAKSYLTSEWLYKKYFSLDELDNTFIVNGFLKSIEQLLWDIILIAGQGRGIKSVGHNGSVSISEENENMIDKTLGSLQYFLKNDDNDDLFLNSFGGEKRFVMTYLNKQISDWRKQYRNGYFHKHNLNDKNKIESIREETYFLYLLILGTMELTQAQLRRMYS